MIAALVLNLRTVRVLWWTPALATALLLVVAQRIGESPSTSFAVSAAAAGAAYVWAPPQVLLAHVVVRSSALTSEDHLPLRLDAASRLRRTVSVVLVPWLWGCAGWLSYWVGCSLVARTPGAGISWLMAINGLALTTTAVVVGGALAVRGHPTWMAAVAAAGFWLALVGWHYLPEVPLSILLEAYAPTFETAGLPNASRVAAYVAWSLVLLVGVCLGISERAPRAVVLGGVLLGAVATIAWSQQAPEVLPRAGRLEMACRDHAGIAVCLWSDHEIARDRYGEGVDLAVRLDDGLPPASAIREGDIDVPPHGTIPAAAERASVTTASARPDPAEVAAALIAGTVTAPGCADEPQHAWRFLPAEVERVVATRRSATDGHRLTEDDVRAWLGHVRLSTARCEYPGPP